MFRTSQSIQQASCVQFSQEFFLLQHERGVGLLRTLDFTQNSPTILKTHKSGTHAFSSIHTSTTESPEVSNLTLSFKYIWKFNQKIDKIMKISISTK